MDQDHPYVRPTYRFRLIKPMTSLLIELHAL